MHNRASFHNDVLMRSKQRQAGLVPALPADRPGMIYPITPPAPLWTAFHIILEDLLCSHHLVLILIVVCLHSDHILLIPIEILIVDGSEGIIQDTPRSQKNIYTTIRGQVMRLTICRLISTYDKEIRASACFTNSDRIASVILCCCPPRWSQHCWKPQRTTPIDHS